MTVGAIARRVEDAEIVRRFDLLQPLGLENGARVDGQTGFLHAPVRLTRSGVFLYRLPDGTLSRELKHPEDVFEAESVESAKRIVATRGHPRDSNGRPIDVGADNVKRLQVGHVGDTVRSDNVVGEEHLELDVTITDKTVVQSILGVDGAPARPEVSPGFTTVLVEESGEWKGERYDRRQTQIRYNHLAVDIDQARGGFSVAVKLDDADGVQQVDGATASPAPDHKATAVQRRDAMKVRIRIDETEIEVDESTRSVVLEAIRKRDAKIEDLEREKGTSNAELQAARNQASQEKARADQATKDLATEKARADAAEKQTKKTDGYRVVHQTLTLAGLVLKADEMQPAERTKLVDELLALEGDDLVSAIRRHVVLKACEDEVDAIKNEDGSYFRARFDQLVRSAATADRKDSTRDVGRRLVTSDSGKGSDWRKVAQARIDAVLNPMANEAEN